MPGPASTPAGCVVDGILYVFGGHYPYQTAFKTVWAYDPRTDSWTRKADMPSERHFHAATAVDGIIYVVGGTGNGFPGEFVLPVAAYDPKTDVWMNKARIPTGRATLAVCAVDGIIYAIGGLAAVGDPRSTVEAYDPKTNQWSTKSPLPRPLQFLTASVANGPVYVFQGSNTFAYDPKTDHWTIKASFSPWSQGLMSATVDGTIYLFGGMTGSMDGSFDFTLAYDPAQDRFTARRKGPRTRLTAACGVIEGKVYLAGGISKEPIVNSDAVYYRVLDLFDPQGGVTPQILSATLESTDRLRLIWQAEAGIKYGVESSPEIVTNRWTRVTLPTGSTVTATNGIVETSCPVVPGEPRRFHRVFEAN
ncbi:MAG: hypothetical protein HY674_11680 [Chloroflexi bacterium]|nr:hypothetical protein [Chloroflexota bacterium]